MKVVIPIIAEEGARKKEGESKATVTSAGERSVIFCGYCLSWAGSC